MLHLPGGVGVWAPWPKPLLWVRHGRPGGWFETLGDTRAVKHPVSLRGNLLVSVEVRGGRLVEVAVRLRWKKKQLDRKKNQAVSISKPSNLTVPYIQFIQKKLYFISDFHPYQTEGSSQKSPNKETQKHLYPEHIPTVFLWMGSSSRLRELWTIHFQLLNPHDGTKRQQESWPCAAAFIHNTQIKRCPHPL